jgi:hypothetical protein
LRNKNDMMRTITRHVPTVAGAVLLVAVAVFSVPLAGLLRLSTIVEYLAAGDYDNANIAIACP